MVHYITGDIFTNRFKAVALAHGCNCAGVMGAGIAVAFAARWPIMKNGYRKLCEEYGENLAGSTFFYDDRDESGYFICNLFTQIDPGPDARYELIENSLAACKSTLDQLGINSLAMPAIGSGIGGLQLEKVKEIVNKVFADWNGEVYFYEKYEANK